MEVNNVLFHSEIQRSGGEDSTSDTTIGKQKREKAADLQLLEQALSQTGRFNLVFEGIADYPQARYLILSRDELNAYRAAILLENGELIFLIS